jgi:16S rRNA (guanine(966)-N(2))-methyltransferase RsmD
MTFRRIAKRNGSNCQEVRPTMGRVLGALFNILDASGDIRGARFLDLFSGTGEVAIAAMKRGASRVLAVESERDRAASISLRLSELYDAGVARCVRSDVRRALPKLAGDGEVFDVIFADPPYGMGWSKELPTLIAGNASVLAADGVFILERSRRDKIAEAVGLAERFSSRDDRIYGETVLSIYRYNC